jgi:sporulation protein YlmC with PRC-barrel domain
MEPYMFDKIRSARKSSVIVDSNPRATQVGATSLMQDDVYDAAGKCLGEIEEMILDTRHGCVRYVVLALGGFLGIGRKRFAIPWSALTPDLNYQRSVLDVAQLGLMAVPVFDGDPWLQRTEPARVLENLFLLRQRALSGRASKRIA